MFRAIHALFAPEDGAGGGAPGGGGGVPAGSAPAAGGAPPPPSFAETLPEDIRGEAVFRDIKDLAGLARSYHGASKLLGNRDPNALLTVPGAEDAEGWDKLYGRLGRPEGADKYTRPALQLPEGMAVNEDLVGDFAAEAHKAGLSDRQFQALMSWYMGKNVAEHGAAAERLDASRAEVESTMRKEWGAAYDQRLDLAKAALAEHGGEELVDYLETSNLGNHPAMLRMFAKLGEQLAEDGKLVGRATPAGRIDSPAEAQQQINALMKDTAFLKDWRDKAAPGHQAALDKMAALYARAYPETNA